MSKDEYRQLCRTEKDIPIFSKDWWLDAVCGDGNWDVILVKRGGQIVASMPFYKKRKLFFNIITMPPLSQHIGIWLKYPDNQKYEKKLSYEKEILTEIIERLPKFDLFQQNFHYSLTNWLPFYWNGFKQTTRYTYVIEPLDDLEYIYSQFKSSVRNKILKASRIVTVELTDDVELFYRVNKMTFERQGLSTPYSLDLLKRQDAVLKKHKARTIFLAKDSAANIHSALYLIWDAKSAYVHLVGENPALRNSGAGSLLVWEALKYTSNQLGLQTFDFEGSMIEAIERVRRAFGAVQKPYFHISKVNSKLLLMRNCLLEMNKNR